MTREERINSALLPILKKMREHGATDEMCKMYDNGFHVGAMWADAHPHWKSVEEELPPRWETNPNVSVQVITCKYVDRELQDIDMQRYIFGDGEWQYGDATHWMPLPSIEGIRSNQRKISSNLSNSSNIGKDLKGGEE